MRVKAIQKVNRKSIYSHLTKCVSKFVEIGFGGVYGLRVVESACISSNQLEAARRAIQRIIGRRFDLRIFSSRQYNITSKPIETRMGKGKGNISGRIIAVRKGALLFELISGNLYRQLAKKALNEASKKLIARTRFVEY